MQTTPFDETFNKLAEKLLAEFHIPGLSIGIVEHGAVFTKGFGFADLENKIPAKPETLYHIGSVSKGVLTTTWTKYIQEHQKDKKLSLQTKFVDIIRDDFVLDDPWATTHLTLEDAFCHRTGMTRHDLVYGGESKSMKEVVRSLRHVPLSNEPREKFDYCNTMFTAATHALEVTTGETIAKTMKDVLFDPLDMKDTYTNREDAHTGSHGDARLHKGYGFKGKFGPGQGGKFFEEDAIDLGVAGGAGFVISNVQDMCKYLKAFLGDGNLTKALRDEVTRPRITRCKNPHNEQYQQYALGLYRSSYHGVELIGHNGAVTGYTTVYNFVPELGLGFIALGNSGTSFAASIVLFAHLLDERLKIEQAKRIDYSRAFHHMFMVARTKKTIEQATKVHYPTLKTIAPLSSDLEEHAGTFSHPGYNSLTFNVRDGMLEAKEPNRTWRTIVQLYHVSGDYWIGYKLNGKEEVEGQIATDFKAICKYGVDGRAIAWGLELEPDQARVDWADKLIWFNRV